MNLYFTALSDLSRVEVKYTPPKISIKRNPKLAEVAIVGRNTPQYHYLGGVTDLDLELDFHSEDAGREDVIEKVKWFESLAYSDAFDAQPETVRLTFGRLFRHNEIWTVKKVHYDLSLFDDKAGLLPRQAYVKLTLALDSSTNLRISDVRWR